MQRQRRGNQSLQAQVNRLTQLVSNLTVARPQRSRSRRRRTPSRVVAAPAATSIIETRGAPTPRGRSRSRGPSRFAETGSLTFTNREMFTSVTVPRGNSTWGVAYLINANGGVGFLTSLGKLFGRYRWINVQIEYESMVSSATDGVIAYGFDWGCKQIAGKSDATTLAIATSLYPSTSHPLWSSNVRLARPPPNRLSARVWYDVDSDAAENNSLAALYVYLTCPTTTSDKIFGAFWITYTVEFQGPHL